MTDKPAALPFQFVVVMVDGLVESVVAKRMTQNEGELRLAELLDEYHLWIEFRHYLRGYFAGSLLSSASASRAELQEILEIVRAAKVAIIALDHRAARWKALAKKLLRRLREERAQRLYDEFEGSCEPGDLIDD